MASDIDQPTIRWPARSITAAGYSQQGDAIHAVLCGAGHNIRLLLRFCAWILVLACKRPNEGVLFEYRIGR